MRFCFFASQLVVALALAPTLSTLASQGQTPNLNSATLKNEDVITMLKVGIDRMEFLYQDE